MTNFEKIETYLKHGLHVSAKDIDGEYLIISPIKDEDGYYRASCWSKRLEEAKENIGGVSGYDNLEKVSQNWTEITPFHLDFEPYPVGMKVQTFKNGFVEKIEGIVCQGIYTLKGVLAHYSHTQLIPYFEEEVEERTSSLEMTIKQIEEKLNITGLKIVK